MRRLPVASIFLIITVGAYAQTAVAESANVLTVEEAIRIAAERNPTLESAREDLAKASVLLQSSWAVLLPTVTAGMNYVAYDHSDSTTIGTTSVTIKQSEDLDGVLAINLPLVSATAWLGVRSAVTARKISEITFEQARQEILNTVAQASFQALTAAALIDVHEQQIKRCSRHLDIAILRHRSGTGMRLDVLRAKADLVIAREDLITAKTSLASARDALGVLLGRTTAPMVVEPAPLPVPGEDVARLEDMAGDRREDVRIAKLRVKATSEAVEQGYMKFVPTLGATWQWAQQISDIAGFGSKDPSRWYLGLSLSVPIYDHTRYPDLAQRKVEKRKAKATAEAVGLEAGLEVRTAFRSHEEALQKVGTAKEKADIARETLALVESAYENGTGDSLTVTDARRSNRTAEVGLITARFRAEVALLSLWRALGQDVREIVR